MHFRSEALAILLRMEMLIHEVKERPITREPSRWMMIISIRANEKLYRGQKSCRSWRL
jgi:hypothetical protein